MVGEYVKVTREMYFEYLNSHIEFLDLESKDITLAMMKHFRKSYSVCAKYYLEWRREVLGLKGKEKKYKERLERPKFRKYKGLLISKNGEYSLEDGGLLLTKDKAYLNFGNKDEFLEFFNEAWTAYERLEKECINN